MPGFLPVAILLPGLAVVVGLVFSSVPARAADANLGPVARYTFEEIAGGMVRDESGKENHLRAQGTVELAPGRMGQAAAISRRGFLQAPYSDSLELGGEMTLEAWVRPEANPASGMRIVDRQTIGGNDGFLFDTYPSGNLRLIIGPGQLRANQPLPLQQWTHVAATYSETDGEMLLYVNGQVVAEGAGGGKLRPSSHPLNIGANQSGGDRFQGLIDEVRIYARALAPEEIAAHAQGQEIQPPLSARKEMLPLPVLTRGDAPQVDHAALCARNDLVFLQPALYPFEAMRLGNGNLGVCQWNAGGMTWQVNNGSYRLGNEPVSSGKVTLSTPALAQAKSERFEQRLRLWDGIVTTQVEGAAGSAEATALVAEGEDCLVFRCRESGSGPRVITLHLWPSRKDAHFVKGADFIAITERAEHAEDFLPTALATVVKVDGARVRVDQRDARTLTLTFQETPAEYTIYVANPAIRGSEEDALRAGQAMIARLQAKGYEKVLAERRAYWHAFWPRSFLRLESHSGEAQFLENLWYLFHYDLASMARNTLCPKFNGGNWLVQEDLRHWGGGYWHQNTREIFWPVYASNHIELTDPYFDLYWRTLDKARERARVSYNAAGLHLYETITIDGGPIPKPPLKPGYMSHLLTVGLEHTLQAWWRYEYSGDERFLRERVYPLLTGCLEFYLSYAKKGPDGKYHLEPANAQETYWAVKDPHQDLAALRWAVPLALRLSERLGTDAEMRPRWRDLLENLAPYPVDATKGIFLGADLKPGEKRNNSENVELYGIYPFGVFGLGLPEYERAKNTFLNRPVQSMHNGWEPAAIVAARLGLGEQAAQMAMAHMRANLRGSSGTWYSPTTTVFVSNIPDSPYYDAPGVCAQTLNEMALQSHTGILRVAPAWPEAWQAQFSLRARGGFVVTAETHAGKARYALIRSDWGGPCRLANPWDETAVVTCEGKEILRSDKALLEFATAKGKSYRVERAREPLARMEFARLSPAPAAGPRALARRFSAYPNWSAVPYLGIDAEGRTPPRAQMARSVADFERRLATATAGLTDMSTGKATATVTAAKGDAASAPALLDGKVGLESTVEVPHEQYAVVDLGAPRQVSAVAFSRDRTGLYVDNPAVGYTVEVSADGAAWTMALDRGKQRAASAGQVETLPPTEARYVRLRLFGQYNRAVRLDEITLFGR